MKKEEFIALGISEEQAAKAAEASKKELESYVPKTDYDTVNQAKGQLEKDIKDRDKQLEDLKKNSGDNAELKKQIETMQAESKAATEKNEADMKELKLTTAIKLTIAESAQDADLVTGLFDKSKLILSDDGKVTGLEEQIKSIKESKPFLFKEAKPGTDSKPGFRPLGAPGQQTQTTTTTDGSKVNMKSAIEAALQAQMPSK
ncbi:phage scaffolding protein [Lacrimispora sp.]|uniref:phage scaffolding protein n=1 Tax=Lacrimispora sp. TaxID=2719234 RepID=UPI0028978CF3|nr:phage scaffolding protein [Lacrimispora sp.]